MYPLATQIRNIKISKSWLYYLIAFLIGAFITFLMMRSKFITTVIVDSDTKPKLIIENSGKEGLTTSTTPATKHKAAIHTASSAPSKRP